MSAATRGGAKGPMRGGAKEENEADGLLLCFFCITFAP